MALERRDFLRLLALSGVLGSTSYALNAEPVPTTVSDKDPLPDVLAPYLQLVGIPAATWVCIPARKAQHVAIATGNKTESSVSALTDAKARPVRGTPWTIWFAQVPPDKAYQIIVDGVPHGGQRKRRNPADASVARVAFLNDVHDRTGTIQLIGRNLRPENHDLVVLLGDIFNDPSSKDGAERTFRTLHTLATVTHADEVPMLYLPGNHDYRGNFADRVDDLFLAPRIVPGSHDPKGGIGAHDQGWDLHMGPVALIAADTGEDFEKRPELFNTLRERQSSTISKALATAANAPWRVFLSHIPLFSDDIWNSEHARKTWTSTLATGKVDVALAGHVHTWKTIPAGKEQVIQFKASPRDSQSIDTEVRYVPPFPTVIGGGPDPKAATLMLLHATSTELTVQTLAADDGRQLSQLQLKR